MLTLSTVIWLEKLNNRYRRLVCRRNANVFGVVPRKWPLVKEWDLLDDQWLRTGLLLISVRAESPRFCHGDV